MFHKNLTAVESFASEHGHHPPADLPGALGTPVAGHGRADPSPKKSTLLHTATLNAYSSKSQSSSDTGGVENTPSIHHDGTTPRPRNHRASSFPTAMPPRPFPTAMHRHGIDSNPETDPFINTPVSPPRATAATAVPQTPERDDPFPFPNFTPQHVSSHDDDKQYAKVEAIQLAVRAELEHAWVEEDRETLFFQAELRQKIKRAYLELEEQAKDWLEDPESGYDDVKKRWTGIPEEFSFEKELYTPIQDILSKIVNDFGNGSKESPGPGLNSSARKVKETCSAQLKHNPQDAKENIILKSSPDISIMGTGPSATRKAKLSRDDTYAEVATPIEIKRGETFAMDVKDQVAVYAREIFIHQHNRRFVYVPLMTDTTIRVIQFDRSGAQASRPINYHQDPIFFIQLVVLFSSLKEELLGYDISIYWKNGKRMMKVRPDEIWVDNGTDKPAWQASDAIEFEIVDKDGGPSKDPAPFFARRTIRSRGTICWRVQYGGQQYLVKDYWGVAGRTPESVFLKDAALIKGIGRLHAYDDNRDSTYALRGFAADGALYSDTEEKCLVPNRIFTRLVLRMYGRTLNNAPSGLHLLRAVRDIVSGHRDILRDKDILHRDISFNNLLLASGEEDGVLIDFDMAKRLAEIIYTTKGDSRTGTRAYQSVKVLLLDPRLGHHDHMDDLESIFYVLVHICYGHGEDGRALPILPGHIGHWFSNVEPGFLADTKRIFLRETITMVVTRFSEDQADILEPLMDQLRLFFTKRLDMMNHAVRGRNAIPFPAYSPDAASKDYSEFTKLIESAIEDLEKLPVAAPFPPPSPGFKRRRDPGPEEDPTSPRKKQNSSPGGDHFTHSPEPPSPTSRFSGQADPSRRPPRPRRGPPRIKPFNIELPSDAELSPSDSSDSDELPKGDSVFAPGQRTGRGKGKAKRGRR
ncbi:hypothetical protein C8R47DRAFT_1223971 [Mycena vitilis]|nr:hypothetical protein C8R47DRAFT_1223971 [Mycena vitilis]